jgi:LmbE family N-acetylglucosaminyl deacetylase
MKTFFTFLLFHIIIASPAWSAGNPLNIVVIGAHPDDCDIRAGGMAVLFATTGNNVMFISVTNGDAGHYAMHGKALAKRRVTEAQEAGRRFGVKYVVLNHHDGELVPSLKIRLELIRLIRSWNADIVITHRPNDYHPDHRNTSILVQDAAYLVIVPDVAPDSPPLKKNPVFLYCEDRFQKPLPFQPDIAIDITKVYNQKVYAMAAHESQFFEWLPWTSGTLKDVPAGVEERVKWLGEVRKPVIQPAIRISLSKWYGEEKAQQAKAAEAFEICEYGRRPSDDEIRKLFPMLGEKGN